MLKLFKPKNRSVIGIDISSSSVKALEISTNDNTYCIEGYGYENLPANALDGNTIKDIDAVASCIKRVLVNAHLHGKSVVLAVPDSSVISKVVQINEGLSDSEIEELIVIEADKYIPYPIDEINIDFEVLGHSPKNSAMLDVLIVASRAENVSSRVEAVSRAGLEAKIVDVESFAVERAAQLLAKDLPAQGQDKIVAVIDIGSSFTDLFVLHGMKIIFTREEEFGGKQLIEAIARQYSVSFDEAAAMKAAGRMPEDYEDAVLQPYIEMILLQIKRTLQFFFSTSHHGFVDHIILAGGVAMLPNLADLVQEKTGIPTSVANPFDKMEIAPQLDRGRMLNEGPSLMIACGLALRTIG
ncbi:pilus assembly protein PilM [Legionella spiritensis]|uniref:Tfp pilus assembly protein, ATPase PilM n=1 Tax=Legionella spiritensis TaxID=452 RepID=A0A0W0Z6Y4_LEGSP|nr:pilus assembly protein PilM [Legionella spiritensis]KTD64885.1 Tfp pilus assembly protein, ATPase PilM [Legionella spiritensis]SNV41122.1 type IV pilus assembly protein PilM [Legionella spiritensis]